MMIPTIRTERLILRPFKLDDAAEVQRLAGDYELYKSTLHIPHPYEDGMAEEWISMHLDNFIEKGFLQLAVERAYDQQLVGCISLGTVSPKRQILEIGYWIGQDYWDRGFGTEASRAVIDYGFEHMNANRIMGRHFMTNPGSGKIMEKCGMIHEGVLRHDQVKDGVFVDVGYYGILKSDWKERYNKL